MTMTMTMMTMMTKAKRQDGWWYPWVFVAAFGVVILVNGTMAYIAVDSWTGLETEKPFERAQAYNAELAQKNAQAALGWRARADFEPLPVADNPRAGMLRFTVTDHDGQGISGLDVAALAVRPTHEGYDRDLTFLEQSAGTYVVSALLPLAGQWDLRVTATNAAGDVFKMRQRILVP